jgi:hypothetical protein
MVGNVNEVPCQIRTFVRERPLGAAKVHAITITVRCIETAPRSSS